MAFCNPIRKIAKLKIRGAAFVLGFAAAFCTVAGPAAAQDLQILRDTETEALLRSYEDPLLKAAGLDPAAVKVYLLEDPSVNSFVAEGQNMFIQTGMILWANTPNQLIGVMAHETGHIKAGHIIRTGVGMQKAMIPMLLSMVIGVAAMIAGAGEAGMVIMGMGQAVAEAQMNAFTRVQESTADQIALQLLNRTHQSPLGLLQTFQRFAAEEARGAGKMDPYAVDHPTGQDRVSALQDLVDASPYRDIQDSPEAVHAYDMVQAKLAGYVLPVAEVFNRYPLTDTGEPARYARAMAYMRKPDMVKALAETQGLIKDEPNNPYFYEVLGQIYVGMARPRLGIPAYQKAVDIMPGAPQLRLGLAVAQLATEDPSLASAALANLKAAILIEDDDSFTWYETAQAYSDLKNLPMANLATAESYYANGAMPQAAVFAARAREALAEGTPDWERANDIVGVATPVKRR